MCSQSHSRRVSPRTVVEMFPCNETTEWLRQELWFKISEHLVAHSDLVTRPLDLAEPPFPSTSTGFAPRTLIAVSRTDYRPHRPPNRHR